MFYCISLFIPNKCLKKNSNSFNVCPDGVGSTVKTCINMGNATAFITHTLPNRGSVLKDQSFSNILIDSKLFFL